MATPDHGRNSRLTIDQTRRANRSGYAEHDDFDGTGQILLAPL